MGSPLGPTLANVFLCYYEKLWLDDCPLEYKPIMYNRYVDDCFLMFRDVSHVDAFLDYLNTKHKNIKYTVEYENNNQLPFLDILITKQGNGLVTDVYRKSTFTGLGLNFLSFVPYIYKINSVKTLIHRAYSLCSNWKFFDNEICKLRNYFNNNGYPCFLFDKFVKQFLNIKYNTVAKSQDNNKQIKYVTLPFQGHQSYLLRNSLQRLLQQYFPDVCFRFVFVNNFTIGSFFKYKEKLPDLLCSNIVYTYVCPDCNARYIGSTCRNLKIRMSEHKGVSFRTNSVIVNPGASMIRNHAREFDHAIKEHNFKIMHMSRNRQDLRIAESLFIHKYNPNLNSNESSAKLHLVP